MNARNADDHGWDRDGLRRLRAFELLPEALLDALVRVAQRRSYGAGQSVVAEQEAPGFVGVVARGILRLQKVHADGRFNIVGLLIEGDMFGRTFGTWPHFAIEAVDETEVIAFRRDAFDALSQRWPELERMVLVNVLNELDAAREWMLIVANHRITERLAGFLLLLSRRWAHVADLSAVEDGALQLRVPIRRTDLAHFLGTRPESLSRAFHRLEDDGLIRIRAPDRIAILDLPALVRFAGGEDLLPPAELEELQRRFS